MEISLSSQEMKAVLSRFPPFELSYEIVKHKTTSVSTPTQGDGEWAFHIPIGRKYFAWFTFYETKKGCFWLELNRDRMIHKAFFSKTDAQTPIDIHYGTILYGTRIDSTFVVEDIFYHKGIHIGSLYGIEKWSILHDFLQVYKNKQFSIKTPVIYLSGKQTEPMYPVHHIQIRHMYKTAPYINWIAAERKSQPIEWVETEKPHYKNFKKPQYQIDTIFRVTANIGDDVYHLYTYGPNRSFVFYDYALIQDYETSKRMNTLFRNVRENQNLDFIEESDDEDENGEEESKQVDLKKSVLMKCRFHKKFKKWMPMEIVPEKSRIVHISQL